MFWLKTSLLLLISVSVYASSVSVSKLTDNLYKMTEQQKSVLCYSYHYGKNHNFGLSLSAISWQESSAGVYLKNPTAPSYGIYQIFLPTAMGTLKNVKQKIEKDKVIRYLLTDKAFGASIAVSVLKHFYNKYNGNLPLVWASYYAGNDYMVGGKYALDISYKVFVLNQNKDFWLNC